jgi:sugar lactone lactonase YvrE
MYSSLLQPYGLALSQDFKHIYVSDADPTNPIIVKLPVDLEDDDNDEEESHEENDLDHNNCSATALDENTAKGVLDGLTDNIVFFNASTLPMHLCCDDKTSSTSSSPVGVQGLAVDQNGNVWATLRNSIVLLSSENGKLLACICNAPPPPSSSQDTLPTDIAFGDDGYLYVTTDTKLLRIKVKSKRLKVPNMVTGKKRNNQ